MPAHSKLPSADVLLKLREEGLSNYEIAQRYACSAEGVRVKLARAGHASEASRLDHSHYLPWRLRADHTNDVLARRLRAYSTLQQGGELPPDDRARLDSWMRFMDGENSWRVPLSVHYSRLDPDGFWLAARRPGDRDYISPPVGGK